MTEMESKSEVKDKYITLFKNKVRSLENRLAREALPPILGSNRSISPKPTEYDFYDD